MIRPAASATVALVPARLRWDGDQPFSRQFGDIYHAPDGADEVDRVFVTPQHLIERLSQCRATFTIGELGFGTALNFAVVAHRYLRHAPAAARLHFISVEKHPVVTHDFVELARRRGRALPIYKELMLGYPPLVSGWHRRHFADGRIMLSVYFGDGCVGLRDIVGRQRVPIDAWLLDGFAPDRNPDLWKDSLWRAIADLSGDGTTIATFSSVGAVRRALADVGFAMHKVDQWPYKRHSLAGVFSSVHTTDFTKPRSVAVVGAGFAGAATARQIANRGIAVTLLDSEHVPPNRMAATLFHCRLLPDGNPQSHQRSLSYLYSMHWYDSMSVLPRPSGVLQFPSHTMTESRVEWVVNAYANTGTWLVPVDAATASSLAGMPLRQSGLFFPHGRTFDLSLLSENLVAHPLIEYRAGTMVDVVATDSAGVRVGSNRDASVYEQVVLCAGTGTSEFEQARYLEVLPVWGQIDQISIDRAPAMPMVGDGFMIPMTSGWGVGATYEHKPWLNNRASDFNLRRFDTWWKSITGRDAVRQAMSGIRAARAVTSDRMPVIGSLFDRAGQCLPRLFVNTGHGSQGTVSAPFAAECIASELAGEFAPCTRAELEALSSMRFRERQARRGPRHGGRI